VLVAYGRLPGLHEQIVSDPGRTCGDRDQDFHTVTTLRAVAGREPKALRYHRMCVPSEQRTHDERAHDAIAVWDSPDGSR
jgi:hypothetical protein